ncbi:3-methyladenine DNA glycosylase AlkD [Actinokineospora baliensis]|uniref:DNA alkylation repair protein n=1 Tax=Actinokineospora baliensis TaxID=547056 RepID=UPI00195D02DC|nr:DNA alkylation repair protein [Actinokineospora baliensis]MBM7775304.1 3-methyladenine DNA glycosylase AlkD [Actinokineospora baliensis]
MDLASDIRTRLASAGDPGRAPDMQRYMKSDMPFRGVPKPARDALVRQLPALHTRAEWLDVIRRLWREATHREERYVALDLLRRYPRWQELDLLPLYEEFVVTGAWWDYVDELASRHIGSLLMAQRDAVTPVMREWAVSEDRWKRRVAVICQLGAKGETDLALLAFAVEANEADGDFFLRKGIGWALRQYARVDADWVRGFVEAHPGLSGLSRREALKHILTG